MRHGLLFTLVFMLVFSASFPDPARGGDGAFEIPTYESSAHDFDFLFGKWVIHNRRLKERLQGSDEWIEFDALHEARPILGGLGNVDEMIVAGWLEDEFRGVSLRLFDPEARLWSIYWVDNRFMTLEAPVVGGFRNGVGEFYDRITYQGQDVLVRFLWKDITENSARWEQAYSLDEGGTWETNWAMDFERRVE